MSRSNTRNLPKFLRFLYFRLIIPIKRMPDVPEIIARGTFIGLLVGFTPTVGIQMYLLTLLWFLTRKSQKLKFNLVVAISWSWLSNPLTMVPFYFVYYLIGKVMLLDFDFSLNFDTFEEDFLQSGAVPPDSGFFTELTYQMIFLWEYLGQSILIGWIPIAAVTSIPGYILTIQILRQHRLRRTTVRSSRVKASA